MCCYSPFSPYRVKPMAAIGHNGGNPNSGGGNGEPSLPSQPTEPAYIKFSNNYVVADYNGGEKSVAVSVNTDWEWVIATSGEEWFSAERVNNDLVVTFSECSDKLQREGTITVAISDGEESAFDTINVLQIGIFSLLCGLHGPLRLRQYAGRVETREQ